MEYLAWNFGTFRKLRVFLRHFHLSLLTLRVVQNAVSSLAPFDVSVRPRRLGQGREPPKTGSRHPHLALAQLVGDELAENHRREFFVADGKTSGSYGDITATTDSSRRSE